MKDKTLSTRRIGAGTRVYYIDTREDKKSQKYLRLTEVPTNEELAGKERQSIFIHKEYARAFAEALLKECENLENVSKR